MREPMRVSCALIERFDLILVAQRGAGSSLALLWEFPGGKIKPNEGPEACVIREIHEELGVEIQCLETLPVTRYTCSDFSLELHPFRCQLLEGEPFPREHLQIRWTHPKHLRTLSFAPADIETLNYYLNSLVCND